MEVRVERCAERSRVKEANIQGSMPNMQYQSQKGSRRSKLGRQIEHPASSRDWEVVEPLTEWTGARTLVQEMTFCQFEMRRLASVCR